MFYAYICLKIKCFGEYYLLLNRGAEVPNASPGRSGKLSLSEFCITLSFIASFGIPMWLLYILAAFFELVCVWVAISDPGIIQIAGVFHYAIFLKFLYLSSLFLVYEIR